MELRPAIVEILKKRGIVTEAGISEFLSDKPRLTYDPFLLLNMERGVDLILSAIEDGKKICVYGDYDADGITSAALLMDVLRALGADPAFYIPSRFDEGYGLNCAALDRIKASGVDLVVTVDCGCTSCEEVRHALEIGLEILVTDHHNLKDELPGCPLIDPKQPDCPYPFKQLAGVGVAFELAQALVETAGLPKEVLTRNLDLVAVGTIGDIVPLLDENRTLTKFGLRALNITRRPGLTRLIEKTGLTKGKLDSASVSFVIVPHINAAGRMGDATMAARLMLARDPEKVESLTEGILNANAERRRIQGEIYDRCLDFVDENADHQIICLPNAHEGVTGIVAGKLKENYHVPVFILTDLGDGTSKGTGRSVEGIDVFEMLNAGHEIFERFGGHAAACGFTISNDRISDLRDLVRRGLDRIKAETGSLPVGEEQPDAVLGPSDIDEEFIREQKLLEPFGKDNRRPLVEIGFRPESVFRMGRDGKYLSVKGKVPGGPEIKGVDFRHADETQPILQDAADTGGTVTLLGELEEQEWKGSRYFQVNILRAGRRTDG